MDPNQNWNQTLQQMHSLAQKKQLDTSNPQQFIKQVTGTPLPQAKPKSLLSQPKPVSNGFDPNNLDMNVVNLAKAIRQHETGNRAVPGQSGELVSRYQYLPGTWRSTAKKFLGDENAPLTAKNEDQASYMQIKEWKDAGYTPKQIASMWNSGHPDWQGRVRVNSAGVKYDVPAYVNAVYKIFVDNSKKNPPKLVTDQSNVGQGATTNGMPNETLQDKIGNFLGRAAGGMITGIAKPAVELGLAGMQSMKDIKQLATGQQQTDLSQGVNVPLLGNVKPAVGANETLGSMAQKMLGYGSDVATMATGAPELKEGLTGGKALLAETGAMAKLGAETQGARALGEQINQATQDIKQGQEPNVLKAVGNVAGQAALGAGEFGALGLGGSLIGKAARGFASEATTGGVPLSDADINTKFNKAIKPSITNRKTAAMSAAYDNSVRNVVKDIVENQDKLTLKDTNGETKESSLPTSVADLDNVLNQRRGQIYQQYSDLAKQAGDKGATIMGYEEKVPVSDDNGNITKQESIIDALDSIITDKTVNRYDPAAVKYAERLKASYSDEYDLSIEDAQKEIEYLNARNQAYYRNPTPNDITTSKIDAMVANKLRSLMDEKISSATGEGYQDLRNKYADIKRVEKDVRRSANRVENANGKSLIDYSDIFSAGDIIKGVATMNPAEVAKGAGMRLIKNYIKKINSPDANIARMFRGADKAVELIKKTEPIQAAAKEVQKLKAQQKANSLMKGKIKAATKN